MKIYLDACCLNRPFDDQGQVRIRMESEAVIVVLDRLASRGWRWIGSEVLRYEIARITDVQRRERVAQLLDFADVNISLNPGIEQRARQLKRLGFHGIDALHLASAEAGGAAVFLTTDDQLLRVASRHAGRLRVIVQNPLRWVEEEVIK